MRIILNAEDIEELIDSEKGLEVEFDASIFLKIGLEEVIKEAINAHTARAGSLYQEIRKQVDEYMNTHLPTEVGNYVRTRDHTAHRIITEAVEEHVEKELRNGIRAFAEKKSKQIVQQLLNETNED